MKDYGWNMNVQHNEYGIKAHQLWEGFALIYLARPRSVMNAQKGMRWDLFLPLWSLPWKRISNSNVLKQSRQKDAIDNSHNKRGIQQIIVAYRGRSLKGFSLFSLCWQLQVAVHGMEADCRRESGAFTLGAGCVPGRQSLLQLWVALWKDLLQIPLLQAAHGQHALLFPGTFMHLPREACPSCPSVCEPLWCML